MFHVSCNLWIGLEVEVDVVLVVVVAAAAAAAVVVVVVVVVVVGGLELITPRFMLF